MKNVDSSTHVRGESVYLDDIPVVRRTLFGAASGSPVAHGIIRHLDLPAAEAMTGVVWILTHKDVTGGNQIGGIVPDELQLAELHLPQQLRYPERNGHRLLLPDQPAAQHRVPGRRACS